MPAKKKIQSQTGNISYGHRVLMSVILLAAKEIAGVASLHGRQIKFTADGNIINVKVYLNILHGYNCADVAFRVQENIKRNVESMTEYIIGSADVTIAGVAFRPDDEVAIN